MAMLAGCAGPSYVDKGRTKPDGISVNQVVFQVHSAYDASPPDCVAILPLAVKAGTGIKEEDAAKVRLSLYAHLSTQSKRNIRLERIDHVLTEVKGDRHALGEQIKCNTIIEGEISEYGSAFYGVYSRVAVAVDLKMIQATDGVILWDGHHTAVSNGGSVPLDPVGLAMSVVDAASNMREEQLLRVTDDLARRLVSTIPDNMVAALEDPVSDSVKLVVPPPAVQAAVPTPPRPAPPGASVGALPVDGLPVDALTAAEKLLADGDNAGALAAAERAVAADPQRSRAWFLKGRVLMLNKDYDLAEPAILKAIALSRDNALYLDALGAVNASRGAYDRALVAYRMAIAVEPSDGFAWYNSAVIYYNAGHPVEAAVAFYGAGTAYLKTGEYAKTERVLRDLRDLGRSGVNVQSMIRTIEGALADLTRTRT